MLGGLRGEVLGEREVVLGAADGLGLGTELGTSLGGAETLGATLLLGVAVGDAEG